MRFKPYYGIEAERVGRDRGLYSSAILSPEVCYLREAIGDFARWARRFVAGLPRSSFCANHHVPPMASTPACCLIDREAPIWRRNAETLTKDGGAFCWIKWSYVEPQRKVAELERSREPLASNTSSLVEGDKGFRDVFEERSFAEKAGQMVPLIELARLFAIRHWHSGGYPITQTGYLPNIYFIRKDEGGRAVRKLHQIHMAIKIEDLAHNDRHLLKPAAARTISNRPA